MSNHPLRLGIAAALLAAGCDVSAMTLSNRGIGQVLVFPYYTVNASQNTLITLGNSTSAIKVLKVRFREAYDGREVASFNVYLSPFDVWTGAVFAVDSDVAVGTRDNSCTAPSFSAAATPVAIPAIAFSAASFTGAHDDAGPTDASRMNEGSFDVFEMGEIARDGNPFSNDILHVDGVPPGCANIAAAWNTSGVWATDPTKYMMPPTGGLFGASSIVNVGSGTYFQVMPSVVDGFSTTEQNSSPTSDTPDFNTASPGADGTVAASVDVGDHVVAAHFAKSIDAVSALFMQTQSINEYVINPGSEQTDWVTTFPTKRFYVDPQLNGSGNPAPFDTMFQSTQDSPAGSCAHTEIQVFDREEDTAILTSCGFDACPPGYQPQVFCDETTVLPIAPSTGALHSTLPNTTSVFGVAAAGYFSMDFAATSPNHVLESAEGFVFHGLPMIGFVAENFINENVTPGVLANYSAAIPHRSKLTCETASDGAPCP